MVDPGTRGLYAGFEGYKSQSDDELRRAIQQSLVVFDTNVLLNMYRYNAATRDSVAEVMRALGDRLWMPHQVLEEFWRNRERALTEPLGDTRKSCDELTKLRDAAVDQLRMWVNRAALDANAAEPAIERISAAFEVATDLLEGLIDESQINGARNTHNDPVLRLLEPILHGQVGPPMDEPSHAAAVKEGARRAEAGIPPGFADIKKSDRGTAEGAAGDYLVWEQVLREVEQRSCPVVFVTGDVKRDWWRFEGHNARGPRIELVREMIARGGQALTMIRPDTLLSIADSLSVTVRPESVEDVERTTRTDSNIEPDDAALTGWTREAFETLLRWLSVQAPVQEATIRLAIQQRGFISRDDVYVLGDYEPERQLKGFTRPVNRLVQDLKDKGSIPEGACDVLVPVYDEQKHGFGWADGFRVPAELVELYD